MTMKSYSVFACIALSCIFALVQARDPQRLRITPVNQTEQTLYAALVNMNKDVITDMLYSVTLNPFSKWPDYIPVEAQYSSKSVMFIVSANPEFTQQLRKGTRLSTIRTSYSYVVLPQDCEQKFSLVVTGSNPINIAIPACASVTETIHHIYIPEKEKKLVVAPEFLDLYIFNKTKEKVYGAFVVLEDNGIQDIRQLFVLEQNASLSPIRLEAKELLQPNRTFKLLVSPSNDFLRAIEDSDNTSSLAIHHSTYTAPKNCTGNITLTITGKGTLSIKERKTANVVCSPWFKKKK